MPFCYLLSVCLAVLSSLLSSFIFLYDDFYSDLLWEFSFFLYVFSFMIEDLHKISCSYRLLFYVDRKLSFNPIKKAPHFYPAVQALLLLLLCSHNTFYIVFTDSFFCSSVVALCYNFHVIHCILQLQHFSFWVLF